jgi:uncharacterized protein YjcR
MAQKPIATDWGAIKTLFLSGITLKELSERFGVKLGTLQSRSSREKWAVPSERVMASMAIPTEKSTPILHDLWQERALSIREKEFKIAEKALTHAEQMTEDQLLAKSQAVDTLAKMGRRATGLDREESNKNAINIALLGDIGISDSESAFYRVAKDNPRVVNSGQDLIQDSDSTEIPIQVSIP